MKMKISIIFLSFFILAASAIDVSRWNEYCDTVIEAYVKNHALSFDPVKVEDLKAKWSKTVLGVKLVAEAKLNAEVSGLSTLKRTKDVVEEGDKVKAELEVSAIRAYYNGSARFMGLAVGIVAEVKVAAIQSEITLSAPAEGGPVTLHDFELKDFGLVEVKLEGIGLLDHWAEPLKVIVQRHGLGVVKKLFEKYVKVSLLDEIEKHNL